ncbi:MAG: hypothetical protein V1724_03945 [Chloroflexota bacterium]
MTPDMEGFLTLYDRKEAASTEEYLAKAAALPARTSQSPLWEALGVGSGEATAGVLVTVAGQSPVGQFTWVDPIGEMRTTITQLEARVVVLEEEIQVLKASAQEEVIVLRTISREQAKEEIRRLFSSGETFYYSDVAQQIRLDLRLVVELCQELEKEGALEVDANYVES